MTHYLSTLRYLTAAQIWHRGRRTVRQRWWRLTARQSPQSAPAKLLSYQPLYSGLDNLNDKGAWTDEIGAAINRAREAAAHKFCFLHTDVSFGDEIRWHDPELSQLWRYHLHYFDYVRDLLIWAASGEADVAYPVFRRFALSWIHANRTLSGDGWHPYTISLRVVNWLHALSFFSKQLAVDEVTADLILSSLYGQVQVLYSNLEFDVRGNHLMENLRALIWAGVAFEGPEPQSWFEQGMRLLEAEVAEQILGDGGHFERAPGYHLVVFKDLLEIALLLKRNTNDVSSWLDAAVRRMTDYLWKILPPNGDIPLLKDSTWGQESPAQELLTASAVFFDEPAYKHSDRFGLYNLLLFGVQGFKKFMSWPIDNSPRGSVALSASGHYVIRHQENGDHMILDAGKTCPDYLPAHAHADSLTYELTIGGQRIMVDSGVYEYQSGPWRDYFRSTRAHNTVEVAAENQSEMWGSFRVGQRARPGPVVWQVGDDYVAVQGEHDGYRRLSIPVIHQRTVIYGAERFWLVVDQLWGNGRTTANDYVHLHPHLSFEDTDAATWRIGAALLPLWLTAFGYQEHSITNGQLTPLRQGWYSENFGQIEANSVLTLSRSGLLPLCFGYVIAADSPAGAQAVTLDGGHEIKLTIKGHSRTLRLLRAEPPQFQ
ncbi:MAG TPA: alginate lyase family protein [Pyrinomonadaceae bacterium]|nr:alginate lyase family protein [Pyrinomonadaceae bacterium]